MSPYRPPVMTRGRARRFVEDAIDKVNETIDSCTSHDVVEELVAHFCDDDLDLLCTVAEAVCRRCGKRRYTDCKGALLNAVLRLSPDEWESSEEPKLA